MKNPNPGLYKHFKGGDYFVMGVAKYSEDPTQALVIYANASGENWARPFESWNEEVTIDLPEGEKLVPRFQKVESVEKAPLPVEEALQRP